MSQLLLWQCECCNFSNANEKKRCSYCDLPMEHTPEQLEKYRQALPEFQRLQNESSDGFVDVLRVLPKVIRILFRWFG